MPGGEAAIREPWRMACAWLRRDGVDAPLPGDRPASAGRRSRTLARTGLASPVTTSMGRLFDAVAALCGVRRTVTYEGQAAIELEASPTAARPAAYPLDVATSPLAATPPAAAPPAAAPARRGAARRRAARRRAARRRAARDRDAPLVLDARPTVAAVVDDLARGVAVPLISARFHNAVADATAEALRDEPVVVLSGGVFQNELLLARTLERLPPRSSPRASPSTTAASPTGRPRSRGAGCEPVKSSSRRSSVRVVPIAITTSPCREQRVGGGLRAEGPRSSTSA